MSVTNFQELLDHKGHKVKVVSFGSKEEIENVSILCETCNEILLDFDKDEEVDIPRKKHPIYGYE